MKSFVQILTSFGFRKMGWEKCPQGFKDANYPCYSHKIKNIWAEVYLGDIIPYMWIIGDGFGVRGLFFDEPQQLESFLKKINPND